MLKKCDPDFDGGYDWGYYRSHPELFDADCKDELGITGNPKADLLMTLAYTHGHSSGYSEIYWWADELVGLIQ
jgi:hypothetical protein